MSTNSPKNNTLIYSTRDLLIMAVLAALGGVTSTYIQMFANAVHAFLGFPGATQWAAGLHVLWIVMAIGITGKPGTGVITGLLKGSVELMSGNTHGVIILVVNLVAGLLVDFGFLMIKNKRSMLPFLIGGGLASGSNVIVFQIFARVPIHILTSPAIIILFVVATISGILFAGILAKVLIQTLVKAGVVKQHLQLTSEKKIGWAIAAGALMMTIVLAAYLMFQLQSPEQVEISGAVSQSFHFPAPDFSPEMVTRNIEAHGSTTAYQGYPITDLVQHAEPDINADALLIIATDGYSFLLSFEELQANPNILLTQDGMGRNATFNVVGPISNKAWVRNVMSLNVIAIQTLLISSPDQVAYAFEPDLWLDQMDSTQVNLPSGSAKLQGVPIYQIIQDIGLETEPEEIKFMSSDQSITLNWSEVINNQNLRLFLVVNPDSINYALANMSGEVHLFPVVKIEVQ